MRKEYEYKINGVSKNKQDFQDYINYEKMVLKQIHTTFNKNVNVDRRNAIEYKIIRRIKNLYEIGLQRFSNDVSFYLSYFKFCKQSNFINAANVAVQNMIKVKYFSRFFLMQNRSVFFQNKTDRTHITCYCFVFRSFAFGISLLKIYLYNHGWTTKNSYLFH